MVVFLTEGIKCGNQSLGRQTFSCLLLSAISSVVVTALQ